MTTPPTDVLDQVRSDLAAWHATHPRATLAEIEEAVEAQVRQIRATLVAEQAAATWQNNYPLCRHCGTPMEPRSRTARRVVLPGNQQVPIERTYVVCPACRAGLFPPG